MLPAETAAVEKAGQHPRASAVSAGARLVIPALLNQIRLGQQRSQETTQGHIPRMGINHSA